MPMIKMHRLVCMLALCVYCFAGNIWAHAADMNFKYEGAVLLFSTKPKFEEYTVLTQSIYSQQLPEKKPITATGEFTRKLYEAPINSSLEAVYTYEKQLTEMGFTVIGKYRASDGDWFVRQRICVQYQCGNLKKTGNDLFKELAAENTIIARKTQPDGDYIVVVAAAEIKTAMGYTPPLDVVDVSGQAPKPRTLTPGNVLLLVDTIFPKQPEKKIAQEDVSYIKRKLLEEGKVDIYGIYFDFDKFDVKPESAPVLKQIADILTEDKNLKLKIVGHTDNKGTESYNQALSEARAQSVVNHLAFTHAIDKSRLQAIGMGLKQPVASNDTEEGKAKNRRVELIKI